MSRTHIIPNQASLSDKCPSCEELIRPADIVRLTFDYSRCPHCGTAYATVDRLVVVCEDHHAFAGEERAVLVLPLPGTVEVARRCDLPTIELETKSEYCLDAFSPSATKTTCATMTSGRR